MTPRQKQQLEEALAATSEQMTKERKARATQKTYLGWLRRYIVFLVDHRPDGITGDKVAAYLSTLSKKSAATQRQALNAIRYYYEVVRSEKLGTLPAWTRASKPARLPSWLTTEECLSLFTCMQGTPKLLAQLLFGAGLRLTETLNLRIKDIDLQTRTITIHGGKGDKDRAAILPRSLVEPIRDHIAHARELWHLDRRNDAAPVELPGSLAEKYPKAGLEIGWFWLFPAANYVQDQQRPTRWHLHPDTLPKALHRAARSARIEKRVSAHTLRHSFATAYLLNGGTIHDLRELLGHAKIETTSIYLHCLPNLHARAQSPLDAALAGPEENLVPFPIEREVDSVEIDQKQG